MAAVYPARYHDAHGDEQTQVENDGKQLRFVVRGVAFIGSDFDLLEPTLDLADPGLATFTLNHGELCACRLEWSMPLPVIVGTERIDGILICFTCAFSDYSPVGHGLFGSLACFRGNKSSYLQVQSKRDLFAIWNTMTEFIQETYCCPAFERRKPGTGYRG